MDKHVTVLGALYIALGLLALLVGAVAFTVIGGAGVISGDPDAMFATGIVATVIGIFLFVIALPSIIAGVGLLKRKPWARILSLILGALNIFNIPFGTALGIYTFWVLLNDQTAPLFTRQAVEA
jgi:dipeptide/tripeptide permease